MIRLKELQRRMDQTLGPPMKSNDKNRFKFTVSSRLNKLEEQIESIHMKLDSCLSIILKSNESSLRIQSNEIQ
jgi:hypothetical protein